MDDLEQAEGTAKAAGEAAKAIVQYVFVSIN